MPSLAFASVPAPRGRLSKLLGLDAAPARAEFPLIADYIPLVEKAVTKGTRRVYGPYWAKVVRNGDTGTSTSPPRSRSASSLSRSGQAPCSAGMPAEGAAPPST
jgi:hypothetical protein